MEKIELLYKKPFLLRYDILSFIITFMIITPIINSLLIVDYLYLKFFMIIGLFFNCLFYLISETNNKYK